MDALNPPPPAIPMQPNAPELNPAGLKLPLPWEGTVHLHYDYAHARTRLAKAWHQAPLKVQRPFYPETLGSCHTVLIHTAGGMVGGDRLTYHLSLAPQAHAVITTAAAGKIYGTQRSGVTAALTEQLITVDLAEGAYLEWLPQETIVFNGAQFQQTLRVNLAPGASWLGWDLYRFGRTARGEQFLEGTWRSRTEVWQGEVPLWIDRQWLPAGTDAISHPHGLKGCAVVGTLAWLGRDVDRAFVETLREAWTTLGLPGDVGVTRLQSGVLCRYRGASTADVRQWFTQGWNHVRSYGLGQTACPVRVWQV